MKEKEDEGLFQKGPQIKYAEEAPEIDLEEFKKVINSRRSVRIYKQDADVPESVMRDSLEMALLAPSSSNLQPWEFWWIRNSEKKKKLVHACFDQLAAKTAKELVVVVARTKTWKENNQAIVDYLLSRNRATPKSVLHYYQKLMPFMMNQGFLGIRGLLKRLYFFVTGFYKVVPRKPHSHEDMRTWAVKSTALACENFMLSIRAHGFDTCPMEGHDACRVRKILGIPSDGELVMIISVGKRDVGGVYGRRFRLESERFIKEIN